MMTIVPVSAQVEEAENEATVEEGAGGIMDSLLKTLSGAAKESLQEGVEEFVGTYKGRIDEVTLLERRGNSLVLKVTYEGVKRKDGVYVEGEVLRWGESLEGFSSSLSPVQDNEGAVRLTIGWKGQDSSGWGVDSEAVTSDQIQLSLVRDTNPERPFGSLVYDLEKQWTDSNDIELTEEGEDQTAESEDGIQLADDEAVEESQTTSRIGAVIKPGSVLKPVQASAISSTKTTSTSSNQQNVPATVRSTAAPTIHAVADYNFFVNADKAAWRSAAGSLPYPGTSSDKRGFVRLLNSGTICPNNKAAKLLQTHPQWIKGGWIEGRYPAMVLDKNVKFKSTGALLKGASNSDGVIMEVIVMDGGEYRKVVRKRINCEKYVHFEADLSKWAGKKVRILLRVNAGSTSTRDWAVWVNPQLVKE
jgi:hypothetical protein